MKILFAAILPLVFLTPVNVIANPQPPSSGGGEDPAPERGCCLPKDECFNTDQSCNGFGEQVCEFSQGFLKYGNVNRLHCVDVSPVLGSCEAEGPPVACAKRLACTYDSDLGLCVTDEAFSEDVEVPSSCEDTCP